MPSNHVIGYNSAGRLTLDGVEMTHEQLYGTAGQQSGAVADTAQDEAGGYVPGRAATADWEEFQRTGRHQLGSTGVSSEQEGQGFGEVRVSRIPNLQWDERWGVTTDNPSDIEDANDPDDRARMRRWRAALLIAATAGFAIEAAPALFGAEAPAVAAGGGLPGELGLGAGYVGAGTAAEVAAGGGLAGELGAGATYVGAGEVGATSLTSAAVPSAAVPAASAATPAAGAGLINSAAVEIPANLSVAATPAYGGALLAAPEITAGTSTWQSLLNSPFAQRLAAGAITGAASNYFAGQRQQEALDAAARERDLDRAAAAQLAADARAERAERARRNPVAWSFAPKSGSSNGLVNSARAAKRFA